MKNAPVHHRIEYALFRMLRAALLRRPHARVRSFGERLGAVGHRVLSSRRLALDNLEIAFPELDATRREEIVAACFRHFGAYFCEAVSIARFGREEIVDLFDIEGWENVEAACGEERGCFLMAGHFGSWELASYPLGLSFEEMGRPTYFVARPPDNPHIAREIEELRGRFGNRMITKEGAGHRMLNAFRKGGCVAMVVDQRVRKSAGIRVPFFGRPAWTSPVLAFLSLHTGAPVVPLRCLPIDGGRYRLTLKPPIEPLRGRGRDEEAQAILTRRYLEDVEEDIRARPELWLWMHRRWAES